MSAIASNNGDYSIQEIHKWLDDIPLSRPIKNMARDFSDGGKFKYKQSVLTLLIFKNFIFFCLYFFKKIQN